MPVDRYTSNSTNYEHPQESNLLNVHKAMEYNALGEPILRTTLGITATDAFGRFRSSQPFTLFDYFHRYTNNSKFNQYTTGTNSTSTFEAHSGALLLSVGTGTNAAVYRESTKVFAYQPGKSLLVLQTFVMDEPKTGKRTRVGYFDSNNGLFLERTGTDIYFVRRSTSQTGTVQETRISQENWNLNKLDGTDSNRVYLDLSVAQIMFTQIEWLGVGSVIQGFVIDGQFMPCHRWDWANHTGSTTTYMLTACLPIRYELENIASTTSTSILREICCTVISEGGYELLGKPRSVGHTVSSPYSLASKDTVYPVFSMRLKVNRLGAIVLPTNFTLGIDKAANYRYFILVGGVTSGGTWVDADAIESSVEYKLNATTISGGNAVQMSYINASNQASISPTLAEFPFIYQLERNTFLNTGTEFTVCIETDASTGPKAWCTINWQELT